MSGPHEIDSHDPLELFDSWLKDAEESEPNDANAAALATSTADSAPSVRMVLVKPIAGQRFSFFTNAESRKGREIAENPRAALCFHWKTLRRQVRVEGPIAELGASAVDTYFHSRPRESQIGAAISDQSRVLASRAELEDRARRFAEANPGEIPRPAHWRGYSVNAERMEFWISGANRLHDRFLFTKQGGRWQKVRLYP
ncbi:MAG: pyridoxamine 5'-phosphate oxidase [Terracidiphilus sp.]